MIGRAIATLAIAWMVCSCVGGTSSVPPPSGSASTFVSVVNGASVLELSDVKCPEGTTLLTNFQPHAFVDRRCIDPPVVSSVQMSGIVSMYANVVCVDAEGESHGNYEQHAFVCENGVAGAWRHVGLMWKGAWNHGKRIGVWEQFDWITKGGKASVYPMSIVTYNEDGKRHGLTIVFHVGVRESYFCYKSGEMKWHKKAEPEGEPPEC